MTIEGLVAKLCHAASTADAGRAEAIVGPDMTELHQRTVDEERHEMQEFFRPDVLNGLVKLLRVLTDLRVRRRYADDMQGLVRATPARRGAPRARSPPRPHTKPCACRDNDGAHQPPRRRRASARAARAARPSRSGHGLPTQPASVTLSSAAAAHPPPPAAGPLAPRLPTRHPPHNARSCTTATPSRTT